MSNLTTYCEDCKKNNTYYCNNERRNSWHCPDFEKKLTDHEKHIMRIAEELSTKALPCAYCDKGFEGLVEINDCYKCLYDWMMKLKEEVK